MSTRTPRPRSPYDAEHAGVALCDIPLRDADGVEIPLVGARVEQIAVDEAYGALPCRLNRQGDVRGRDQQLVYVLFDSEYHLSALRPTFVRLVAAPDSAGSPAGSGQRAQ